MKTLPKLLPIFLLLLFFSPVLLKATSDLKEGYYVSTAGDTIRGFIVFESGEDNYTTCRYKASKNAETQNFGPDQIRAYSVEGKRLFVSQSEEIRGELITAFFEVLIEGEVTLYKYRERFYLESDNQLKWLHIEESKEEKEGKVYTTYSRHHIKILFDAFESCPELKRDISGGKRVVLIREKILVKLFEDYYKCSMGEFTIYKKFSSQDGELGFSKLRIGIHAGMSIARLSTDFIFFVPFELGEELDYGRPSTFGVGVSLEYSAPRVNERFSLVLEPYFQQNNFQGFGETLSEEQKIQSDLSIRFKEIIIPLGVKYILLSSWNDFYISTGISQQLSFGQEFIYKRKVEDITNGSVTDSETNIKNIKKSHFGAWFGTGLLLVKRPNIRVPLQIRFQSKMRFVDPRSSVNLDEVILRRNYGHIVFLLGAQF